MRLSHRRVPRARERLMVVGVEVPFQIIPQFHKDFSDTKRTRARLSFTEKVSGSGR